MSLVNALAAAALNVPTEAILKAQVRSDNLRPFLYADNEQRRRLRMLLDGAALSGSRVTLAFVKCCGELRYMVCQPVPSCYGEGDATARYATVKDLELSEQARRDVFRRVNLDGLVAVRAEFALLG